MRILVACEFSGRVRDAFIARGHDAWSCDLLPTERDGPHLQCDVLSVLDREWDLMIAHPPCTYLANSGARWLTQRPPNPRPGVLYQAERWEAMEKATAFFCVLLNSRIPKVAVENSRPHKLALAAIGRKYDQEVQPWQFGEKQKKGACLWLRGLPLLTPTNIVGPPPKDKEVAKAWERVWREPPGPNQAHNRSRSFDGISQAMAAQWG